MSVLEKEQLIEDINNALINIRPHLMVDGGDIEVVDVTDEMTVKIKWLGNCEFCSMSAMTMKAGVEQAIKLKIPEINAVEAINGI
jgi:Fe-S cluster biogenesis protein NfuA